MAMAQAHLSTANRRREMECVVCLHRLHQPKTLTCLHNFCGNCLEGLVQDQKILCPTCRKETKLGPGGVGDLPKNTALINIIETMCEICLVKDQETLCEHCSKWMCSVCHASCKRKQKLTGKGNTLLKDVKILEKQISEQLSELTTNVESVIEQIETRKREIVNKAELSAKLLKNEARQEQTRHSDALGKLAKTVDELKRDISQAIDDDYLKDEDISEKGIAQLTGKWRGELSSCQSEIVQANGLIEFIASKTTSSVGEIMTNPVYEIKQFEKSQTPLDYEHTQFECSTIGIETFAPGRFDCPTYVVASSVTNNLIVLDTQNNRVQLFNERYEFVSDFGSEGDEEGQFDFDGNAGGLCVTDNGMIVVADTGNNRLQVFTERGEHIRSIGSEGSGCGQFDCPAGLAAHGRFIYVCDRDNCRIQVLDVDGTFVRQFGSEDVFQDEKPIDITLQNGDVYVAACEKLFVFTAEGDSKGVLNTGSVSLDVAIGVNTDRMGNIIVSDYSTHNIHILTTSGKVLRTLGSEGHGPGQLLGPGGLVCMQDGRIIVADSGNHRIQVFSVKC